MKETSKHLEELNAQFIRLEEQLRDSKDNNETLEKKIKESNQKIRSLQVLILFYFRMFGEGEPRIAFTVSF